MLIPISTVGWYDAPGGAGRGEGGGGGGGGGDASTSVSEDTVAPVADCTSTPKRLERPSIVCAAHSCCAACAAAALGMNMRALSWLVSPIMANAFSMSGKSDWRCWMKASKLKPSSWSWGTFIAKSTTGTIGGGEGESGGGVGGGGGGGEGGGDATT